MDSLESKLDRLTPGQRREVDDFVDFLLQQSGGSPGSKVPLPQSPPQMNVAPPPLVIQEPLLPPEAPSRNDHDIILAAGSPAPTPFQKGTPSPIQEIADSGDDFITHDYMDYGKFDQEFKQSSPAIEAVKNVKKKLSQKIKEDKTHKLLDWID